MSSQLIIKAVLLVCVAGIGWMMLRSPGGARHQAGRRLATLAFVFFAIAAIAGPSQRRTRKADHPPGTTDRPGHGTRSASGSG